MIHVPGYQIKEQIYEGPKSIVFRAIRDEDNASVVLKLLKGEYPTKEDIARFKREFEIVQQLKSEGVIHSYNLIKFKNSYIISMEDVGGKSISSWLPFRQLDVAAFLRIAIQISKIISLVHQKNIIHKDINPSNVVWNPENDIIKLIDFGISTELSKEHPDIRNPNGLDGTLAYISPEQTGRMNRNIDYRSDFYSLGVMLYEMLAGELPFKSKDPLELVHAHIAKVPKSPYQVNQKIPEMLSKVIMKLISKTAEDRYQSTHGLCCDLENCLNQLMASSKITSFDLGGKDICDRFIIPEKLYGREEDIQVLMDSFDRVSKGAIEVVLVTGVAGIGKSSLVNEINKPIIEKRGYFISGKFDKLKREVPYTCLGQVFSGLVKQILADTEENISQWKKSLKKALGVNAQLIIDIIPELEFVMGKQEKVPDLGPTASQNRFSIVFQNFVQILTTKEHPVAIFFDDLQWADTSSLKLIELLSINPKIRYLMIIGAYRDNEVDSSHPLNLVLKDIESSGTPIERIYLKPLSQDAVRQLVADTLNINIEDATLFSDLCLQKTQGNPFFLTQFLRSLYDNGLISFDVDTSQWAWDIKTISSVSITDNVVDLMISKIQELPEETQCALQFAACIGSRFNLLVLSLLLQESPQEVSKRIWPAMDEGLILPVDESYKLINEFSDAEVGYRFLHDRVLQAAYETIEKDKRSDIHLKIGKILLENAGKEGCYKNIFTIVNQLNAAFNLITDQKERKCLCKLNFIAGRRARSSSAYDTAFSYFKKSIALLEDNVWHDYYRFALSLYNEAAENAFLSADPNAMEQYTEIIASNANDIVDQARSARVKVAYMMAKGDPVKGLTYGSAILKKLGVHLPMHVTKFSLIKLFLPLRFKLLFKSTEQLINIPYIKDKKKKEALGLLINIAPSFLSVKAKSFPVVMLTILKITLKYGYSWPSPMGFTAMGIILCGIFHDFDRGYRYAKLAIELSEKHGGVRSKGMLYAGFSNFISNAKDHIRNSIPDTVKGYNASLETGDVLFASLSLMVSIMHKFFSGYELNRLSEEASGYIKFSQKMNQDMLYEMYAFFAQGMENLLGKNDDPLLLTGIYCNEDAIVFESGDTGLRRVFFNSVKLNLCFLFGQYEEAYAWGLKSEKIMKGTPQSMHVMQLIKFYSSLSALQLYDESDKARKKEILKHVRKNQKILKKWANSAPMNYMNKYCLVEAEIARLFKQDQKAIDYYDKATALARGNEFIQEEALADELAARFFLSRDRERIAKVYMKDAHYVYSQWGASAKIAALEEQYPQLLAKDVIPTDATIVSSSLTTTSGTRISQTLDLASLMKASQAISSEIVFNKLVAKVLHILIENIGAEKGILILERDKQLYIEGECNIEGESKSILESIPITSSKRLPLSIIQYVLRTKRYVVLNEAVAEGQFSQEKYIIANKPKSILCAPIMHHGDLLGILYFENCLTTNAFTSDRLEVLELLSGQASISIENARLYSSFERFVPKRFLKLLGRRSLVDVQLGDSTQQELSVLFCDIRDFTSLAERLTPEEVFSFINKYLSYMGPVILKYGGFIDKYIGDAIMALFPQKAEDALEAAVELEKTLVGFNQKEMSDQNPLRIGVSINTGMAILGTVGGAQRIDGSVMGDAVNTSSRLESLNKIYGTSLLISEHTVDALQDPSQYTMRLIDRVRLHGKKEAIRVWQVLDGLPDEEKYFILSIRNDFEQGWQLYRKGEFQEARQLFTACLKKAPNDKASKVFISRCERYLEKPPSEDWDGVTDFHHK